MSDAKMKTTTHAADVRAKILLSHKNIAKVTDLVRTLSVDNLATLLSECRDAYYNTPHALVEDAVYDVMEDELRERCPSHALLCAVGA